MCQSTYDNIGSKLVDSFYVNTFSVLPLGRPCPRVPPWESCDENTVPLDVGQGGFRLIFLGGWVEGSMESVGNVDGHISSSQLLECLGIQDKEEGSFIL